MIATNRYAVRCIHCAFRSQQLVRRCRRLRSSAAAAARAKANDGDHSRPIRHEKRGQSNSAAAKREYLRGSLDDGGIIRRYLTFQGVIGGKSDQHGKESFGDLLRNRVQALKEELKEVPVLQHIKSDQEAGEEKAASFNKVWKSFAKQILSNDGIEPTPWKVKRTFEDSRKTRGDLREAYRSHGINGLDERIKYAFYGHVTGSRFTASDVQNQKMLADLRYPTEWFPATRVIHRTIHLHVGPTNSGKTYHALQRLEQAERGVYAGPLRLLAQEVFTRMNARGKPCSLVTGEERRAPENADTVAHDTDICACTVEMMPLNKRLDVAIIDEIQMIGNPERGWAWTQALLGVKAKEVHLCGEERTVPLIKELCASVGEKLEIHRYERLSPLKVAETSLGGDLKKLRKGDCIVSFSVIGIHALRRQIEKQTGRKVATVYGSLPPETRAQQARLFNDPNNDYDYLVASDAVGMGLNLAIKRIVFEASSKFDGIQRRTLGIADIKQIAGRAGRYRTAAQAAEQPSHSQDLAAAKGDSPAEVYSASPEENVGLVTTLEAFDFPIIAAAMTAEPEPIRKAGLFPPSPIIERFASYFPPGTPFSYILIRLHELSQMHNRFHLCGLKDQIWIADIIEPVQDLTIRDRNVICNAPATRNDKMFKALMLALARCIAEQKGGDLFDIKELPLEVLEAEVSASREYLRSLELLHKAIVTYLWLSYRFAGIFSTRALAFHVRGMVEEKIEEVLGKFSFSENMRRKLAAKREAQLLKQMAEVGLEEESIGIEEDEGRAATEAPREGEGELTAAAAESQDSDEAHATAEAFAEEASPDSEAQVSLTAGVEPLVGEEDLELEQNVTDDAPVAEADEEEPTVSSFAQWRAQQTRGESQGSEPADDDVSIFEAFDEAQDEAESSEVERPSEGRLSVSDSMPAEAQEQRVEASSETLSPEQDASDVGAPVTPETAPSEGPLQSQAVSPKVEEPRTTGGDLERVEASPPGAGRFGSELSAKHLVDIDVNVTEAERNATSRP